MHPHVLVSATRGLLVGLDLLVVGLTVLAVLQADRPVWRALVAAVLLLVAYVIGRRELRVDERAVATLRGRWWPNGAWVLALVVAWVAFLLTSRSALWLAFPLVVVAMHALGPHVGFLVGGAITVVAAVPGLTGTGDLPGAVVGPVLGGMVAMGVVLGFEALAREARDRQRTLDELEQVRDHLAGAERERAVGAERERLARELHDSIAQGLSAIDLLLRAARSCVGTDDERARTYLDQAQGAVGDSLAEARRIVEALTPVPLDGVTLSGALARLATSTRQATEAGTGSPLGIRVGTVGETRALPAAVETALLRVAQSALGNVVQHADARRVDVTLTFEPDAVLLDVVDDGRGFDPDAGEGAPRHGRRGGFGLSAIRSRVKELGGSLTLETAPGEGTALVVRVPTSLDAVGSGPGRPEAR